MLVTKERVWATRNNAQGGPYILCPRAARPCVIYHPVGAEGREVVRRPIVNFDRSIILPPHMASLIFLISQGPML